jgi:transcriptional regulator with XRE-family HTH domain
MVDMLTTQGMRRQFADNLRRVRERAGLSQETLGAICKLHRTEISLLERCKRSPRLETIVVLAHGLQLSSPAELLENIH